MDNLQLAAIQRIVGDDRQSSPHPSECRHSQIRILSGEIGSNASVVELVEHPKCHHIPILIAKTYHHENVVQVEQTRTAQHPDSNFQWDIPR
ncbi:hypothetical protein EMPG_14646 [Blastomyces silverae]|uniref:Uncharacterized protein n=1 Tax=Blastomyces silverae TaxID=2060906 RepID=A0A0H1BF17_9EURO|nr:hypothetical protein EMPG_14646 [Blastomyces silverae]